MDVPLRSAIQRLRAGKAQLRRDRINAPLEEKVQNLLRLQRVYVDIVGSQRPLSLRQRPWDITSTVKDTVVLTADSIESAEDTRGVSASSAKSHWVRPIRRWALRT